MDSEKEPTESEPICVSNDSLDYTIIFSKEVLVVKNDLDGNLIE